MNIDADIITGFLSGSVATLTIREIINQINRKVDFKRELKRITYQRKLEIAEKAVAYYWTYLSKVVEVKKSLETIHKTINEFENSTLSTDIVVNALNQNAKILGDLAGERYFDVNGVHLYFDLDNEMWNEEDLGSAYDKIAEMNFRGNDVQYWSTLYNSDEEKDGEQAQYAFSKMKESLPAFLETLQCLIDLMEKNRQASHTWIKKIKKQIDE